jgi:hypothetical protein
MRRARPINHGYTLEIAPRVWSQLGVVPHDVFRAMQLELESIAQRGDENPDPERPLVTGGYRAVYELNREQRLVMLVDVSRDRASTPP